MTTVTFDNHKFVRKLREASFDEKQVEAITDAFTAAHDSAEPMTKKDLQQELAPLKTRILQMKWMLDVILVGVASLVIKTFFWH